MVSNRRVKLEAATLEPGTVVAGTVKSLKDYGAVISLSDGVEGLLHVSQVSQVFVEKLENCLAVGDDVCCVVIKVAAADGSISLSTKMLEAKPGEMVRNSSAVFERAAAAAAAAPSA